MDHKLKGPQHMDEELSKELAQATISVPTYAKLYRIGLNAAYRALRAGADESILVGGAIRVPTAPLRKKLKIEQQAA